MLPARLSTTAQCYGSTLKSARTSVMPIKVGDRLPSTKFRVMTAEGPAWKTTDDIFKGKKVALFAVPGAFTGVCSKQHLPSVVANVDALKAKGVSTIAVTGVNDISVLDAWKKASNAEKVEFLSDGNGEFAKAIDVGDEAAGFAHQHETGRDVPRREVAFPIGIEPSRRDPGKIERGGPEAAQSGHPPLHCGELPQAERKIAAAEMRQPAHHHRIG